MAVIEKYAFQVNRAPEYLFNVRKKELQDERNLNSLGMGFTDYFYTFYKIFQHQIKNGKDIPISFIYQIDHEMSQYGRTVYTFYDLLSDVGGLYGTLQIICQVIVAVISTIFGSGLRGFIIGNLFKLDEEKTGSSETDEKQISPRKPAMFDIFSYSICACKSAEKRLIEAAGDKIDG